MIFSPTPARTRPTFLRIAGRLRLVAAALVVLACSALAAPPGMAQATDPAAPSPTATSATAAFDAARTTLDLSLIHI